MPQYKVLHKFGSPETNRLIEQTLFTTQKSAYQFERRHKKKWNEPGSCCNRPVTRMIKKDGSEHWEQYTIIGNKLITVSELEQTLNILKAEAQEYQKHLDKQIKIAADMVSRGYTLETVCELSGLTEQQILTAQKK